MEQKDQDKTEAQIDWNCWDCGKPGFITHKGRRQCRACFQASTRKTQNEVRAVWLLLRCQKSRKPGSYLFLCKHVGILEEGIALINESQRI